MNMASNVTRLFLYETEVRDWIQRLDGITLPQRTAAGWRANGLIESFRAWAPGVTRTNEKARGRGVNACRYTPEQFAQVRLVAMLRYGLRVSIDEVRSILREHGEQLRAILKGKTDAVLLMDPITRKVVIRRHGTFDFDVRANQLMLDLKPLTEGNEAAARAARREVA